MNFFKIFFISFALTHQVYAERIVNSYCSSSAAQQQTNPTTEPERSLQQALVALQRDFETSARRRNNPDAYVQALNNVIKNSSFNHLLSCGQNFSVHYLTNSDPSQVMYAHTDYAPNGRAKTSWVALTLKNSVQRTLFAYMHERSHICDMDDHELKPEEMLISEIRAFLLALNAYKEFVPLSTRLCEEHGDGQSDYLFWSAYAQDELALERGDFVQSILRVYLQKDFYTTPNLLNKFTDSLSDPITYQDESMNETYKLLRLSSDFKNKVEKLLNIKIVEPPLAAQSTSSNESEHTP